MTSSNCRNEELKMAGITQNWEKRLILIVVPQLRIADGSRFVKKVDNNNTNKDDNNNNHESECIRSLLPFYWFR